MCRLSAARARLPIIFLSIAAVLIPATARAATSAEVQGAIDKAKAYLYSQMKPGTFWETTPARDPAKKDNEMTGGQWGATTALATYALLAAGESPQEPRLAKAIEFLRTADLVGTYAVALRAQVWLNVPRNVQIEDAIKRDAKLLLLARRTKGKFKGLYTYTNAGADGIADHSCSQFGVLGVWACSDGTEGIPDDFWSDVDRAWRSDQSPEGSWTNSGKVGDLVAHVDKQKVKTMVPSTASVAMTEAGVATLFITQDFLYRGRGLECTGNIVDKNIDLGMNWIAGHYNEIDNPYQLFGIESIGAASGYKYIGTIDWYQKGADWVLHAQQADGSVYNKKWDSFVRSWGQVGNTSLSLLFLARGRAPVMMNKLDYSTTGNEERWNQRPRDAYNIAKWVGKQTERTLNWQITNLTAPVDDWHDAPILYLAGSQGLNLAPADQEKLKKFIEQGGIVMGNADCAKMEFADSFLKLGSTMFPYEFVPLASDSTILHEEQFQASKWKRTPNILAMTNGARVLMLLLADSDPGKAWQFQESVGREAELFQLAANIFLYSVDKKNLNAKGETYLVEPRPDVKPAATIAVTRLKFAGNWDPEPGGWRRLSAVMHNTDSVDVTTTAVDPGLTSALAGKKIAHLTGAGPCKLNPSQINGLKQFIAAGGTLIVDAAGGNAVFASNIEEILPQIFGEDAAQLKTPLASDNALYAAGGPLGEVSYRQYSRATLGAIHVPRLKAITHAGRIVCVYSAEDLSVGLVGQPVDGIVGYTPASATTLMRKILLSASGVKSNPPPQPVQPTTAPAHKSSSKKH